MRGTRFMILGIASAVVTACGSSRPAQKPEKPVEKYVTHRDVEAVPEEMPTPTAPTAAPTGVQPDSALDLSPSGSSLVAADVNELHARQHASAAPPAPIGKSSNPDDEQTTKQIRKAVLDDKTLSFGAKNVQIATKHGKVTLHGVVANEIERQAIEDAATKVAGSNRVENQLQVRD